MGLDNLDKFYCIAEIQCGNQYFYICEISVNIYGLTENKEDAKKFRTTSAARSAAHEVTSKLFVSYPIFQN